VLRAVVAIVASLLIAVQVVRNAAVRALAETRPAEAAKLWSDHPASEIGVALTDIARASRARRPVPAADFALIAEAAEKAPLAPEPFLVRGVQAGLAGDGVTAQRAFEAAQWRNPRSLPAAFFLADHYFRTGDMSRGMREVAALARLSPDGGIAAVPYLAQYAVNPVNWPALRTMFTADPQLARPVLVALASNMSTVPAALALAGPHEADPQWLATLIDTLMKAGDYARAHAVWARAAGVRPNPNELLHDTEFRDRSAPPPFNWQLASSTVGLAERQPGGRLHVLFYGDEDGTLASQLLTLTPGTYRLSMRLQGDPSRAHALTWSMWCDKAPQPIASVTLDAAAAGGWQFQVPSGCPAQWLKLSGTSAEMSQQSDISVSGLAVAKVGSGA
jgi:hypothetical protein